MDDTSQPSADSSEPERPAAGPQLPLWPPEAKAPRAESPPEPGLEPPSEHGPFPDQPWTFTDLGVFILFAAVSFLIANLTATALFLLIERGFGRMLRVEDIFALTPFIVFMQVIWEVLWFLFIYYTITVKYRRSFWQAIRWIRIPQRGTYYIGGGIVLAAIAQGVFSLFPSQKPLPIERLFTSAAAGYLLALFGICVAPFIEELVFRGYFYPVFERRWGFRWAVGLTALLFALIHGPQLSGGVAELAAIFVVGLTLSYTRGKTGSLVPPYLMHLGYNATLFISLYLTTDRFRALQG